LIGSGAQVEIEALGALVERNEQLGLQKFYEKKEGVLYNPKIAD